MAKSRFTQPAAGKSPSRGNEASAHRRPDAIYHPVLDVWSVKQGSLRLIIFLPAVAVLVLLGLYFSIGSIISFNQVDSDARDMITNLRMMLKIREAEHTTSNLVCYPKLVSAGTVALKAGESATPIKVDKKRWKLPDPRLLPLADVVQTFVTMRDLGVDPATNSMMTTDWSFFVARIPSVPLPAFSWDAVLPLNTTFAVKSDTILQLVQVYNTLQEGKRPDITYDKIASTIEAGARQFWTIEATFSSKIPAYKIERVSRTSSDVRISRPTSILIETQYVSVDVPATTIETDVTSDRYNNGQPALKLFTFPENASEPEGAKITRPCDELFDRFPECRLTLNAPMVHSAHVLAHEVLYTGPLSGMADTTNNPTVSIDVQIRDLSQPRPYAPLFVGFGLIFFVGFGFLCSEQRHPSLHPTRMFCQKTHTNQHQQANKPTPSLKLSFLGGATQPPSAASNTFPPPRSKSPQSSKGGSHSEPLVGAPD